ncbi:hypothetical protein NE237_005444 [Protea cynaroides]|uniref:Uncharacterized protein n=1 Tax=Protea cynaroides TaxID=273540 RepID=A0A9Q0QUJ8_9MAGN|nr:hypothetical protein NE237_005444 [Protea cynaroides]
MILVKISIGRRAILCFCCFDELVGRSRVGIYSGSFSNSILGGIIGAIGRIQRFIYGHKDRSASYDLFHCQSSIYAYRRWTSSNCCRYGLSSNNREVRLWSLRYMVNDVQSRRTVEDILFI